MTSLLLTLLCVSTDRPDIVIVLADDLGYGDVGFNGCPDIPTPHIDALAAAGCTFTSGYAGHPFCSPTRAGLMSGRYQHRFGYTANVAFDPHNRRMGIPTEERTLAARLKNSGYRTGMVGKWHLGAASNFHPMRRGFDRFYGFLGGGHNYFEVNTLKPLHENYFAALDDDGKPTTFDGYLTDVFTDEAVAFIDSAGDKPLFLYAAYNAPHGPLQAPEEKLKQFASIEDEKRQTYAAMVSSLDDGVGRIVEAVERRGRPTLIAFLSDNGGPENANASDNGPLRGQKGDVWEGGIRVPFTVRFDGVLPAGSVCETPVISHDLSATALMLAGVKETGEGLDLMTVVSGNTPPRPLFWKKQYGRSYAVRAGDLKLVGFEDNRQLYDLAADIGEQTDLAADRSADVERLEALYAEWDAENRPSFFPGYRDYHEQLKAFHKQVESEAQTP